MFGIENDVPVGIDSAPFFCFLSRIYFRVFGVFRGENLSDMWPSHEHDDSVPKLEELSADASILCSPEHSTGVENCLFRHNRGILRFDRFG